MRRSAAAPSTQKKRCAIYTRKSTTVGLEQEFNSLDAQRERCLTYVAARADWQLVETRYDDGGFTGANIDRPAFQQLLADVEARRVDVVVVYKVDRLSRSLLDFVKVMERFTAADASFVSVTQNFSTADAMGRLTLNMLMSFAEFEREMIAERTRDKICAARRKGKWTGGPVPFGYDCKDKRLHVNDGEAAIVREAFALFLDRGEAALVAESLNQRAHLPRPPANAALPHLWSTAVLSRLLKNPIYTGQMRCGAELCQGEQPAIISMEIFAQAQKQFASPPPKVLPQIGNAAYILRGLARCARCRGALTAGSTRRNGKEYRYYRCVTRDKNGKEACRAGPLQATLLEDHVVERIATTMSEAQTRPRAGATTWIDDALANFAEAWPVLSFPNRRTVLGALLNAVVVDTASRRVELHFHDAAARARTSARALA